MGNACSARPRVSAIVEDLPTDGSKEASRRSSSIGALPSSLLGSTDRENLRILESAEQEGLRRGRGNSDGYPAKVVLLGASAVGKTTLLRSMVHSFEGDRVRTPNCTLRSLPG